MHLSQHFLIYEFDNLEPIINNLDNINRDH